MTSCNPSTRGCDWLGAGFELEQVLWTDDPAPSEWLAGTHPRFLREGDWCVVVTPDTSGAGTTDWRVWAQHEAEPWTLEACARFDTEQEAFDAAVWLAACATQRETHMESEL